MYMCNSGVRCNQVRQAGGGRRVLLRPGQGHQGAHQVGPRGGRPGRDRGEHPHDPPLRLPLEQHLHCEYRLYIHPVDRFCFAFLPYCIFWFICWVYLPRVLTLSSTAMYCEGVVGLDCWANPSQSTSFFTGKYYSCVCFFSQVHNACMSLGGGVTR